jgi:hypothetical protein
MKLKMKNIFKTALLFLLCACKTSFCPGNEKNIAEFKKNIEMVKSFQESKDKAYIDVDGYRQALFFLSGVTGVATRAEYSSTLGYKNEEFYKEDMTAWMHWLNKNKCKLTTTYVDSTMAKFKITQ